MSDSVQDPTQAQQHAEGAAEEKLNKGKGRLSDDSGMEDDDDDEDDYEEGEGDVEEPDEDNMEEIDQDNIVGNRTRGKNIDFAQAAKDLPEDDDEDDEDDDFVGNDEDEEMADS